MTGRRRKGRMMVMMILTSSVDVQCTLPVLSHLTFTSMQVTILGVFQRRLMPGS
jgi:hypothetical protein